jgi:2,4-diketo-3-deoxy-L-fuconate hydrolase
MIALMIEHRPFALGTFEDASQQTFAGLVDGGDVTDLRAHFGESVSIRSLLEQWPVNLLALQALADSLDAERGRLALSDLRPLPPVQPPGQIFQAGANYRQHVMDLIDAADGRGDSSDGLAAGERDHARTELEGRLRDGKPFVFLGSAHAMVGATDSVILPSGSLQHDWELELAAVIGRTARRVPRSEAMDVVAGYMICNDLTARDALRRSDAGRLGLDWLAGKNSPTFLPTGPLLVPAVHVPDPMRLRIKLSVNGRLMQDESTEDMVFDIAALIEYISTVAELRPGDVVLTGSPAGNGAAHGVFLQPGDVIDGAITGLGQQRNQCVAEDRGSASAIEPVAAAPRAD